MTVHTDHHCTVPDFDHDHGGGFSLCSHLIHDHQRPSFRVWHAREADRRATHRRLHEP